ILARADLRIVPGLDAFGPELAVQQPRPSLVRPPVADENFARHKAPSSPIPWTIEPDGHRTGNKLCFSGRIPLYFNVLGDMRFCWRRASCRRQARLLWS